MYPVTALIVEDKDATAMDLQNRFKYWGYKAPMIVSSMEEALKEFNKIKPDIMLIDNSLNEGIELAKKVTDNFDTAVIYITRCLDEEMMQYMRATKPYGYISTPFEENQIKYTVEKAIYRRKIHQEFISSK